MPLTANAAFTERHTLETVVIANPAAGDPVVYIVPDNSVIQVVGLYFTFQTSVVVADRRIGVYVYQGAPAGIVQGSVASVVQADTLTYQYDYSCGVAPLDATADASPIVCVPLACGLQLQAGEQLHIYAFNMDAADTFYSINMRFYGWKED